MQLLGGRDELEREVAASLVRFYAAFEIQVVRFSDKRRGRLALKGWPDLVCFCPAKKAVWLHEIKAKNGRQSHEQSLMQQLTESCGMVYLCGGVGAARAHLITLGLMQA